MDTHELLLYIRQRRNFEKDRKVLRRLLHLKNKNRRGVMAKNKGR